MNCSCQNCLGEPNGGATNTAYSAAALDHEMGGWRQKGPPCAPTYSHYTPTRAYLNGLTPLAHPLGANFVEGTFHCHWTDDIWTVTVRVTHSLRGDDAAGDQPTGSLPQVGDIDRTSDTYSWLDGTPRRRWMGVVMSAEPGTRVGHGHHRFRPAGPWPGNRTHRAGPTPGMVAVLRSALHRPLLRGGLVTRD